MRRDGRIFVAGHRGLVGSAIVRRLRSEGFSEIVTRTRQELDLLDQQAVNSFFSRERIDYVFLAAATVGGIHANATQLSRFLYENVVLEMNVLHAAAREGVEKLLFLGSSCIYPREAAQPLREESLLTGPLEPTNEAYAIAKIAGLKFCEYLFREEGKRFISAMPTNLYGPGDNFDPIGSHVIPALLRRFHDARVAGAPEVVVWGSGMPRREFLFVEDLAEAVVLLMQTYEDAQFVNIGSGEDQTIAELAAMIAETVGYRGVIRFDPARPDGAPRKLLDVSRVHALGWKHRTSLRDGLRTTYDWAVREGALS
jgi:GDP-L-fucose synthase